MHVLVTGGAGYIGSILVGELLNAGQIVTVLDSFEHGVPSLAQYCAHKASGRFTIERGDVRSQSLVEQLLARVDAVIPLAALVGAPLCNARPWDTWAVNSAAIANMAARMSKEQLLIIPTTNSGYGMASKQPCTEESPLLPSSTYGQSKVDAEYTVMQRANSVSLRLATVFGMSPRMRMDLLVNDFVWQALTRRSITLFEANYRRNFIHVRDVAAAFLHVLFNFDHMRGQRYNVGLSTANLTKLELCKAIQRHVPFHIALAEISTDPDKRDYNVSNDKFEATGWQPDFTLDDGIAELLTGYAMFKQWGSYGNV